MKSWSEKLFFKINEHIGDHKWLDKLMVFCAHDLVYILVFLAFMWATTTLTHGEELKQFIKLIMTAGAFSFLFSWSIALISPKKRPMDEYPEIENLLKPAGTWKTFPSDHTIGSFTISLITAIMGAPAWFVIVLVGLSLMIGFGRVYVGVHYPKDILGGIVIAVIFALPSPWLLANITQPVYNLFKQLFLL
jgi:undecaprenyl-diphosphatase